MKKSTLILLGALVVLILIYLIPKFIRPGADLKWKKIDIKKTEIDKITITILIMFHTVFYYCSNTVFWIKLNICRIITKNHKISIITLRKYCAEQCSFSFS